jgi:hypothetical protein
LVFPLETVAALKHWPADASEQRRRALGQLLGRRQAVQDEHRPIPFGTLRLIRDWELLIVEKAVRCVLRPQEVGHWAYESCRPGAVGSRPAGMPIPGGTTPRPRSGSSRRGDGRSLDP